MKQVITVITVITVIALAVMLFNTSFAANGDDKKSPAPEVIKCEGSGSCEMTEIEKLPKPKKGQKKTDKK